MVNIKTPWFFKNSVLCSAGVEGSGIGFAAWVIGSIVGVALGWLLIHVINVQSFGWTFTMATSMVRFYVIWCTFTGWFFLRCGIAIY